MGKLCECDVDGKISKKMENFLHYMSFNSEFCLCFFFGEGFVHDSDVRWQVSAIQILNGV